MKTITQENFLARNSASSARNINHIGVLEWLMLLLVLAGGTNLGTAQDPVPIFQRIKSFGLPSQVGTSPYGNLILGIDGAFYGTTSGQPATVFKINPDGSGYTALKIFTWLDGASPQSGLIQAVDGTLFGTTYQGGPNGGRHGFPAQSRRF